ncbi:MAG: hypothetical protein MI749_04620, partial [Desulfovibrionales bacterium]|nr:hypothetical protein [Desulfovibrionales bacterium]
IVLAQVSIDIHTGVTGHGLPHAPLPFELIPGMPSSRRGIYPGDSALLKQFRDEFEKSGLDFITGPILTVAGISGTQDRVEALEQAFSPLAEAMEGAAAAHIAALYGIPFMEIRSISNRVGERDKSQWDIPGACLTLAQVCQILLDRF